jgi:hypothetical protein
MSPANNSPRPKLMMSAAGGEADRRPHLSRSHRRVSLLVLIQNLGQKSRQLPGPGGSRGGWGVRNNGYVSHLLSILSSRGTRPPGNSMVQSP